MQITDCKEDILHMGYYDRMPNTALGLSLNSASASSRSTFPQSASPLYKVSPPHRSNQAFNAAPLSFLAPNMAFKSRLDQGYARQSPPVQLELLPLRPTSHKPSVPPSPASPSFLWQQQISAASFSTQSPMITRGIDVNQLPSSADHDDLGESSPTGVGRTSESSLLMKRERERSSDAEQERTCEVSSRGSDEEGEGGGSARKKLRLSKEQSTLLEESFKEHSTLNPKQKAELAKQLNLRPRQVEVWFQNRRARTKLKQTEVDCELLKRCCESLTEENRRLQKELQELRAIKVAPPCVIAHDLYMPLPAATLTMCPSCERLATHAPDHTTTTLGFAAKATPSNAPHHLPHHHHRFSQQPPQQQQLPSAAC